MKITKIQIRREEFELSRPYAIAFRSADSVSQFIVQIECDGLTGLGSASPEVHVTGEDPKKCEATLELLQEMEGNNISDPISFLDAIAEVSEDAPAARAAMEIALYDIWSQKMRKPLCDFLGRHHRSFPTSITIGIKSLSETLTEAQEYLDRGFKILKLKLGEGLEIDVERSRKLREKVGSAVKIRVDMNQAYTLEQYQRYAELTKNLDIEFHEQPIPAESGHKFRALSASHKAKICIDESLLTPTDASFLSEPSPCAKIFNIKLMKCGGITAALEIANIAHKANIDLMWGCMDESCISIAAALHTALSCPNTKYLDLDGSLDLARDVAEGGFLLENGEMTVGDRPGLGVTLL